MLALHENANNDKEDVSRLKGFICDRSMDIECPVAFSSVGQPKPRFNADDDCLLVRALLWRRLIKVFARYYTSYSLVLLPLIHIRS